MQEPDFAKRCQKIISIIRESTKRADSVIKNVLTFSRSSSGNLKPALIHGIINEALGFLNVPIDIKMIEVKRIFQVGNDAYILADVILLQQLFLNLFSNAIDAMDDHGVLTVETSYSDAVDTQEPRHIQVRVSDNGKGMSEKNLKHLFEPFFTTKAPGKGTGLGLSIVYRIAQIHNADIRVQSKDGGGTTFILTFRSCEKDPA
jgi:signal transduction histidine kinase